MIAWKNTADRYGAIAKTLHWAIGLLVLMMLVMGLVMDDLPQPVVRLLDMEHLSPPVRRMEAYSLHKAIGITILALIVLRLGWRLVNWGRPGPHANHKPWERGLAHVVHWAFYALLIAMPLSGWILTSASNSTINWFGYFVVPSIVTPDRELREVMGDAHELIANGLWVLIGLHVAGALKHAIIDRDGTLRRMLPFAAVALMMLPAVALAEDEVPVWTIDRDQSKLIFEATQEGAAFTGQFTAFDGTITFDPDQPETGKASILIDLGSIDSQNDERDETVKGPEWFDIGTSPTATYIIDKFEKTDRADGAYLAIGRLVLRGIEEPLDLPFTLTTEEKDGVRTAHAKGETVLKRLDFGVGDGQWADESMVGNAIAVRIDILATAKKE